MSDMNHDACVEVGDAFQTYQSAWLERLGREPTEDDLAAYRVHITDALAGGDLRAKVRSANGDTVDVPPELWTKGASVTEGKVPVDAPQALAPFVGAAMVLDVAQFRRWLAAFGPQPLPNEQDFDPEKEPTWTLLMALAWIATRNFAEVRWQMSGWRRANGLSDTNFTIETLAFLVPDEVETGAFDLSSAFRELKRNLEAGDPVASAMCDGETTTLLPMHWSYGGMQLGAGNSRSGEVDVWVAGSRRFHDIRLRSADIIRLWPARTVDTPSEVVHDPAEPSSIVLGSKEQPASHRGGPRSKEELKAEALCEQWLREYIRTSSTPVSKKNVRVESDKQPWGASVSRNGFQRAWNRATKNHPQWREGGDTRRRQGG